MHVRFVRILFLPADVERPRPGHHCVYGGVAELDDCDMVGDRLIADGDVGRFVDLDLGCVQFGRELRDDRG